MLPPLFKPKCASLTSTNERPGVTPLMSTAPTNKVVLNEYLYQQPHTQKKQLSHPNHCKVKGIKDSPVFVLEENPCVSTINVYFYYVLLDGYSYTSGSTWSILRLYNSPTISKNTGTRGKGMCKASRTFAVLRKQKKQKASYGGCKWCVAIFE